MGTLHWLPPEIIKAKTDKNVVYTTSADIWSFGIFAIEIANREPPNFTNKFEDEILNEILEKEIGPKPLGEKWSDEFNEFVKFALNKNEKLRLTNILIALYSKNMV